MPINQFCLILRGFLAKVKLVGGNVTMLNSKSDLCYRNTFGKTTISVKSIVPVLSCMPYRNLCNTYLLKSHATELNSS